jgi:hypothetical protein
MIESFLWRVFCGDWEFSVESFMWLKMISLGSSLFPFFFFFLLHANAFFYSCTLIVSVCFSFLLILDWGPHLKILVLFAGEFC